MSEKFCASGHLIGESEAICSRCNGAPVEAKTEAPVEEAEVIAPESEETTPEEVTSPESMIGEDTEILTREEMVAEIGEEAVAEIEAEAEEITPEEEIEESTEVGNILE